MGAAITSNFAFLAEHDQGLVVIGTLAERAFHDDPVASIVHSRRLAEGLARAALAHAGITPDVRDDQAERLRRLRDIGVLTRDVADLFHALRKAGNAAAHEGAGDAGAALHALKFARLVSVWFHRSFGRSRRLHPRESLPRRADERCFQ